MVESRFIKCAACSTLIRLRSQIGYYNIPFNFCCHECKSHIHGEVAIDQEKLRIDYKINNSIKVEADREQAHYVVELSAEFPTRKMCKHDNDALDSMITPFIRNMQFIGGIEDSDKLLRRVMSFSGYCSNTWIELKSYFELFWNNKIDILAPKLKDIAEHFIIKNQLDASTATHQLLIMGIGSALPPDTIKSYMTIGSRLLMDKANFNELDRFVSVLADRFVNIEKKAIKLIDEFSKIYSQLIPVMVLHHAGTFDRVDKDIYGIMTANYDAVNSFYANSFEWILENIDIIIGLNNIEVRGGYDKMKGKATYQAMLDFRSKINRLDHLDLSEPYSKILKLDNKVRNAIAHFDNEIDNLSQKIIYTNKSAGKTSIAEIYFIDLALLCIENFEYVCYILELVYNLRKIAFIREGMIPNVKAPIPVGSSVSRRTSNKKVGRNDPCPCGSGQKYKKCCIKEEQ